MGLAAELTPPILVFGSSFGGRVAARVADEIALDLVSLPRNQLEPRLKKLPPKKPLPHWRLLMPNLVAPPIQFACICAKWVPWNC